MSDSVSKYFENHGHAPTGSIDNMDVDKEIRQIIQDGRRLEFFERVDTMVKTFTYIPARTAMKLVIKEMKEESK